MSKVRLQDVLYGVKVEEVNLWSWVGKVSIDQDQIQFDFLRLKKPLIASYKTPGLQILKKQRIKKKLRKSSSSMFA